jgi:hypothetical protein
MVGSPTVTLAHVRWTPRVRITDPEADPGDGDLRGIGRVLGGSWSQRPRLLSPAGIAVLALVVTLAPLAFLRYSARSAAPAHPAAPTTSVSAVPPGNAADQCAADPRCGASPGPTLTTLDPGVAALAPFGLTVVNDGGISIGLRWQLVPATVDDPMVLEQTGGTGVPAQYGPPSGTTTYTVTGLNPRSGYCFRVGVVLQVPRAAAAASPIWSGAACVRAGSRELVAWTWSPDEVGRV